ncbi:3-oxoacyl-ACP reductase [Rhodovulum sp. NI22]|nr:3-oxoacyl-ACP reductase [Rhodovulum sp. NI22]
MKNLFDLTGKTALVTGGANGMGRMIAQGLIEAGAHVIVTSRKETDVAEAIAALSQFGSAEGMTADLSSAEGVGALSTALIERGKPLHIVINNAGRTFGAPLAEFPDTAWSGVMMVNVQAPFTLVRDLLPLFKTSGSAEDPVRVINIGSVAGARVENLPAYSYAASKAAIHHLSKVLAIELADEAITVNTVLPGYFPTKMTTHIRADDDRLAELRDHIPMGRMGTADDIAGACIFLCSRAGAYVTGAQIPVDGGVMAGG